MTHVVLVSGSPSDISRTGSVVDYLAAAIARTGLSTQQFSVRDFRADALLYGQLDDRHIARFISAIHQADAVVFATPVYQSSFSGALKLLLDVIPQKALTGKVALPVATGGSARHLLVLDYALNPVLSALGAASLLDGVFVASDELTWQGARHTPQPGPARDRLDASAAQLSRRVLEARRLAEPAAPRLRAYG